MIFAKLSISLGVGLGVLLATGNWFVLRHLGLKMIAPGDKSKARLGIFLALKSTAMLGAVILVLVFVPVHPVAFVVGISSLILGVMTHSIHQVFARDEMSTRRES